ncbi:hypothetical protein [Anaeromicrobium sediminis]|nr:hypothetical protein [Anaeromicrobium sediminis]
MLSNPEYLQVERRRAPLYILRIKMMVKTILLILVLVVVFGIIHKFL